MKYRKKPVVIEAIRWTGNNANDIKDFCINDYYFSEYDSTDISKRKLMIVTLEGNMRAEIGDYIIKGVNGEFYPCKPDIFEKTYEAVD